MTTNRVEVSSEVGWAHATDEALFCKLVGAFWKGKGYKIDDRSKSGVQGVKVVEGRSFRFKFSAGAGKSAVIMKLMVGCEFVGAEDVGRLASELSALRHECLEYVTRGLGGPTISPFMSSLSSSSISREYWGPPR